MRKISLFITVLLISLLLSTSSSAETLKAKEHLATKYGVSMEEAQAFIMGNINNLSLVYNTCKDFGVSNDMIAEIIASDFPGLTGSIVSSYFDANGFVGSSLNFTASNTNVVVTESQKLLSTEDEEQMGYSVAIDGNTMVVSAFSYWTKGTNKVYIYERGSNGFARTAILTTSSGDDYFGNSVDISGDTIVVGAIDGFGYKDSIGSAYIFTKASSSGWTDMTEATAKLTPSDGALDDSFGYSVAISGDIVVVGAKNSDIPRKSNGSAYVFTKPAASSWVNANETAKLVAFDDDRVSSFGCSVDVDGDKIVIGAKATDNSVEDKSYYNQADGAVYVFKKPQNGIWINTNTSIKIAADREHGWFGSSVAIDGTTIAIGSPGNRDQAGSYLLKGALYIYEENLTNGAYEQKAVLTASDGEYDDHFAREEGSIDISGDTVIVGAKDKMTDAGDLTLSVSYLFKKPSNGWTNSTENNQIQSTDIALTDEFGISVAIDQETIVIGASGKNLVGNGTINDGATYIFNIDNK